MTDTPPSPNRRVLVVDDEPAILQLFVRCFRKELIVTTASGGRDALDLARAQDFDFALLDYAMPEMNGIELARALAHLKPQIPRIMITAHHQLPEVRAALADGLLHHVIGKPWTPAELRSQLISRNFL